MKKEERLQKQRQRLAEMKAMEDQLRRQGLKHIAGVDEVGRGPLAGPVVAAAVVLPEDFDVLGVDDSKKLSEKRREELYRIIREKALAWGIGQADHRVIDEINILQATKLAMRRAIEACDEMLRTGGEGSSAESERGPAGTETPSGKAEHHSSEAEHGCAEREHAPEGISMVIFDAMELEDLPFPQQSVIKGDAKVLAVAAASILAKVTRDRMMVEFAREYPGYAFEKNKGYGTAAHYEGLRERGVCPIHRRTFLKKIH